MNSANIVGYAYEADIYCPEHIVEAVCKSWNIEGHGLSYDTEQALNRLAISCGIDRMDESSYDSDNFPKVEWEESAAENESTCCICHERLVEE